MFFIFGMFKQLFHLNIFSHPSRGSGHGLGLQKCEARAVGPRKPCGGFIELGLTGLGLGWPAASRPGRHITNHNGLNSNQQLLTGPDTVTSSDSWHAERLITRHHPSETWLNFYFNRSLIMPAVYSMFRALTTSLSPKPPCLPRGIAQREAPALTLHVTYQIFALSQTSDTH